MTRSPLAVLEEAAAERLVYADAACTLGLHPAEADAADQLAAQGLAALPTDLADVVARYAAVSIDQGDAQPMVYEFTRVYRGSLPPVVPTCVELSECDGDAFIVEVGGGRAAGPVWFACHDPPVLVLQAATLAEFLDREIDAFRATPSYAGLRGPARAQAFQQTIFRVFDEGRSGQPAPEARASQDRDVAAFAASLPDSAVVFDFRRLKIGDGIVHSGLDFDTPCRFAADPLLRAAESDRGDQSRGGNRPGVSPWRALWHRLTSRQR